ncbi:TetR/AcrR family transcriptional regulator, partial [Xanthomonas euvesicatoria]
MSSSSPLNSKTKSNGPGRPKDLGKRAAILGAARTMFMEQGYAGVSMDGIAAQAGVSKLTVYSHFGDKESLFS